MSLMKTVTKMAIGFAMAKGMSAVQQKGGFGKVMEGLSGAGGGAQQAGGLGGLGDIMGQLSGGGASAQAGAGGGIGDLLGQLTGGGAAAGGGLAGLGGLLGGIAGARGGEDSGGGLATLLAADNPADEPSEDEVATLMIRAMAQAAQADGAIDEGERTRLMSALQDSDPADIEKVQAILDQPVDAAALARDTPKGLETQVYTMSVNAITPDNQAEAQYLHDLAQALGIQPQMANQIHDSLGAQRLYS